MMNIIVRRKRSRMLMEAINKQKNVESGNLKMEFWDGGLAGDDWVKVFFRESNQPIAMINAVGTFGMLVDASHPHANTDATRYQVKQLRVAIKEIVDALVATVS